MIYLLIAVLLFASLLIYFRIADKYNIIDKPNQRSSHTRITIRGGGIVFPVAMLLFYVFFGLQSGDLKWAGLLAGTLAISVVSFWDDVSSLPNKVRILVHLLAVSALLYSLGLYSLLPWWGIVISYILIIGTINAYNFMDGINGITGAYSLAILLSCLYFNERIQQIMPPAYLLVPVIACLVFLFFNFRTRAKCFAGDVGSVSIGFWIISVLAMIMIATSDFRYLFFLAVYGVDAILTIMHRLLLKQNIFEAHRLHFYQILANERKVPHLLVATLYALVQLAINAFILFTSFNFILTGAVVCLPLILLYLIKPRLMRLKAIAQ